MESVTATIDRTQMSARSCYAEALSQAPRRLDDLLERAVATAQATFEKEAASDPYRGRYVSQGEVAHILAREPGVPTLCLEGTTPETFIPDLVGDIPHFTWLQQSLGLSIFDLDVILIALAPEIDLRYERLYAYLQDDVTRRRPSVDLALNLLCASAEAKLRRRVHFAPEAPLSR